MVQLDAQLAVSTRSAGTAQRAGAIGGILTGFALVTGLAGGTMISVGSAVSDWPLSTGDSRVALGPGLSAIPGVANVADGATLSLGAMRAEWVLGVLAHLAGGTLHPLQTRLALAAHLSRESRLAIAARSTALPTCSAHSAWSGSATGAR